VENALAVVPVQCVAPTDFRVLAGTFHDSGRS
jgi:hypothetical protein